MLSAHSPPSLTPGRESRCVECPSSTRESSTASTVSPLSVTSSVISVELAPFLLYFVVCHLVVEIAKPITDFSAYVKRTGQRSKKQTCGLRAMPERLRGTRTRTQYVHKARASMKVRKSVRVVYPFHCCLGLLSSSSSWCNIHRHCLDCSWLLSALISPSCL